MAKSPNFKSILLGSAIALGLAPAAFAADFNIPSGDLESALDVYTKQSGVQLMYSDRAVKGVHTKGAAGQLSADEALSHILKNTGFVMQHRSSGAITIVRGMQDTELTRRAPLAPLRELAAAAATVGIESVVVTSSKIKGDIQTVPIAITALSQEQLTSRQIAGGPDLVKEVPNLTFSKTNFTGYNIQIRGIGTQAISVTTDPAVAVAFNDIPFIRNHFFEQEFYDVSQVEVLRGPQGTLYGRNATAGVVNVISAKPTDQFEASLSADIGNYRNRRFEGMINVPVVDDRLDIRAAAEWTKRDGYSFDQITNAPIDGRDLWSSRVSVGWKPGENLQATLIWEHFQENDDRMRTAKQLCKTAPIPTTVDGVPTGYAGGTLSSASQLSQGCLPSSLYSADAFEVPNGYSLAYYSGLTGVLSSIRQGFNVYSTTTQSQNLRVIESSINPIYKAKNDTVELNADYQISQALTVTSQTGYNHDFLWSTEDYNRFNSAPGAFRTGSGFTGFPGAPPFTVSVAITPDPIAGTNGIPNDAGVFCDPQLGCSDRLVAQDLSDETAWQLSQEFRLASNFGGPLNFSAGGNYLHYETEENYYVFINTLTLFSLYNAHGPYVPGVTDNTDCLPGGERDPSPTQPPQSVRYYCRYIDPNPLTSLNNEGHNYFLSQNPYSLNSYAGFGEVYYNIAQDVKLTGGLRWTEDRKRFIDIPSQLVVPGYGYAITGVLDQQWDELTGRAVANWTPKLDFTDQTLVYGSYAHGYKAGGANPPGATLAFDNTVQGGPAGRGGNATIHPIHPLTFKPEFIDAFELGTKNTLLDGALTFNGDIFYYDYKNYQISRIVDRTAINDNFNAHIKGAEIETMWEPAPGLKFNFAGGYEDARAVKGSGSIDLMDRTAGNPNWMVVKPFVTEASNCILPTYVIAAAMLSAEGSPSNNDAPSGPGQILRDICAQAYTSHFDPLTNAAYAPNPTGTGYSNGPIPAGYPGFDPLSVDPAAPANVNGGLGLPPNNGEGFAKDLSNNELPNAPHFTASLSAEYTLPVSKDWAATLHSDFYWQSQSYARIFNDRPYDKIRGYSTTNLALILTSASGWQVLGYLKNVFNVTAITGDFLNSDDSGLTTNVFLTDPRLYGVRVTKNW